MRTLNKPRPGGHGHLYCHRSPFVSLLASQVFLSFHGLLFSLKVVVLGSSTIMRWQLYGLRESSEVLQLSLSFRLSNALEALHKMRRVMQFPRSKGAILSKAPCSSSSSLQQSFLAVPCLSISNGILDRLKTTQSMMVIVYQSGKAHLLMPFYIRDSTKRVISKTSGNDLMNITLRDGSSTIM